MPLMFLTKLHVQRLYYISKKFKCMLVDASTDAKTGPKKGTTLLK